MVVTSHEVDMSPRSRMECSGMLRKAGVGSRSGKA